MPVLQITVRGMTCGSCTDTIEQKLRQMPGVVSVDVFLREELARVQYDESLLEPWQIISAIDECGFEAFGPESAPHLSPAVTASGPLIKDKFSHSPIIPDVKEAASVAIGTDEWKNIKDVRLEVHGMTCASCVASIEGALRKTTGVISCTVALLAQRAEVSYDPTLIRDQAIADVINDIGFEAFVLEVEPPGTVELQIYGMHCASCSSKIEREVGSMKGIDSVSVNLLRQQGRFCFDKSVIGVRDIIEKIESLGFNALVAELNSNSQIESLKRTREIQRWRTTFWTSFAFSLPVMTISMFLPGALVTRTVVPGLTVGTLSMFFLTLPVQFGVARTFYISAKKAIQHSTYTMDVLVILGTSIAFWFSVLTVIAAVTSAAENPPEVFFETSATLITFVTLGRYLENLAKGKTSDALANLMTLTPPQATLVEVSKDGRVNERRIPSELIQVNDVIKVLPGERIAADGIVESGSSTVDESLVTGESAPVRKRDGDSVISGTINGTGTFQFRATRVGSDTTLSHILKLVTEAQTSKAPIQDIADSVASYFVPGVILLSAITLSMWLLVFMCTEFLPPGFPHDHSRMFLAVKLAISVVIVACPCALGLATPTAVMVGTGVGAQHGILIKGGSTLSVSAKLSKVVFDKTGTLTNGKMSVVAHVFNNSRFPDDALLNIVFHVESGSEHAVGSALAKFCKRASTTDTLQLANFEALPGLGVRAGVSGIHGSQFSTVIIGNELCLKRSNVTVPESAKRFQLIHEAEGRTVVFFAIEGDFIGSFAMADSLKDGAALCVQHLRQLGLQVCMITGDQELTARVVARACGIEEVHAAVSPSGKKQLIEQMQQAGDIVAMIGDGVNDSASIAQSDIGFSVYGGTDVAMEAASIVLMKDDIYDIVTAIDLSRTIYNRILWNFLWATFYNILMIPLAMGFGLPWGVFLHPMLAGMAMSLSSVSVVVSSLLLKFYQPPARLGALSSGNRIMRLLSSLVSSFAWIIKRGNSREVRAYSPVADGSDEIEL